MIQELPAGWGAADSCSAYIHTGESMPVGLRAGGRPRHPECRLGATSRIGRFENWKEGGGG
jgi:hypothetical protein